MGRAVSAVTRRAASNGSSRFLTQTFSVSFHGLTKARYVPSGDRVAAMISGLPKNNSRSIRTGRFESVDCILKPRMEHQGFFQDGSAELTRKNADSGDPPSIRMTRPSGLHRSKKRSLTAPANMHF